MSVKYQITLPEPLAEEMRATAARLKVPLAQFIRETMEDKLARPEVAKAQGDGPLEWMREWLRAFETPISPLASTKFCTSDRIPRYQLLRRLQVEVDQWYSAAVYATRPGLRLVTSSLVISETTSLLQSGENSQRRWIFSSASAWSPRYRSFTSTPRCNPKPGISSTAGAARVQTPVDCASFAIMRRMNIKKAFTFDQHFRTAGFEILR